MARQNTTKYLSNKQEKSVAKDVGGKTVIASGSIWSMKADCRNESVLIECKTTKNSYYNLTLETWSKIELEALKDNMRLPVMCIELENKDKFAVVKDSDFNGYETYNTLVDNYSHLGFFNNRIGIKGATGFYTLSETMLGCMPWSNFLEVVKDI